MLRQRVITAVVLLVVLGEVLGSGSAIAFNLTLAVFFGAACWEALRLSGVRFVAAMVGSKAKLQGPAASADSCNRRSLIAECTARSGATTSTS